MSPDDVPATLPDDALFALIARERRALAQTAREFDESAWQTPSLAEGWRVHEVMAHLTMPFGVGMPGLVLGMIRHRGNFDAYADAWARRTASERSGPDLAATLEAHADSRFTPPRMGPIAPLVDLVVHGLDITVPLGLPPQPAQDVLRPTLDFLTSGAAKNFGVAPARIAGRRFEAADLDWAHGSGETVRATGADLVLLWCRGRDVPPA